MRSSRLASLFGGLLLVLCTACDDPAEVAWQYLDKPGTPRERRADVLVESSQPVRLRGEVVVTHSVRPFQRVTCVRAPCPQPKEITSTWYLQSRYIEQRIVLGSAADAAQQLEKGQYCLVTGVLLYPRQPNHGPDGTVTDWSVGLGTLTLDQWRLEECTGPKRGLWQ